MTSPAKTGLSPKGVPPIDAVNALVNHGILAVRKGRTGEILAVKHVTYGWLSAKEYSTLQMLRDAQPYLVEFIRAGYEFKARIYTGTIAPVAIFGSDIEVPIGVVLVSTAFVLYEIDKAIGAPQWVQALDLACLVLPFGELWLFYHGAGLFWQDVGTFLGNLANAFGLIAASGPGQPIETRIQNLQTAAQDIDNALTTIPVVGPYLKINVPTLSGPAGSTTNEWWFCSGGNVVITNVPPGTGNVPPHAKPYYGPGSIPSNACGPGSPP